MKKLLIVLLLLPLFVQGQIRNIVAKYPIDEPSVANLNDGIRGAWKFKEDTNKNNYYEIIRGNPYAEDRYHIKFWDRGGTNPTYESNLHFSKIGNTLFINVPYFELAVNVPSTEDHFAHQGFFFLKVLDVNADFTKMTVAAVHDTTLWNLDQAGVTKRITKNVNNPAYYSAPIHLYKVK